MKILIVTLRRLGDVLLTTPLVRSVRRGFPDASVDMLVFAGSERILKGNPDIDRIITTPERPSLAETTRLVRALWRRYDLAICTQTGDRPTFMTLAAGRRRVGLVPGRGGGWKRWVHDRAVVAEADTHRVSELLRLVDALDVSRQPDLVCPQAGSAVGVAPAAPYAVLHPNPFYRYKRWNDAGWRDLARGLSARGLAVVVTQGRGAEEGAYVDGLFGDDASIVREQGRLDWAGLTALLQGAAVYVGPDTSVTHLAAGSGCPTVALYGATSPCLIGRGRRPDGCNGAAMSGWCRTRCRACHASNSAATAISTAARSVWMSLPPHRYWRPSIKRCSSGKLRSPSLRG